MPLEPRAELDGVGLAVLTHGYGFRHLRLDLEVRVGGEQGIPHHVAMVAGNVRGGPDGIDDLEVGVHDCLERCCPRRVPARKRRRRSRRRRVLSLLWNTSLWILLRRLSDCSRSLSTGRASLAPFACQGHPPVPARALREGREHGTGPGGGNPRRHHSKRSLRARSRGARASIRPAPAGCALELGRFLGRAPVQGR